MAMVIRGEHPGVRPEDMRFKRIETRAVRPDGRIVTGWYSFPLGTSYEVYRKYDADLVRLYGNENSRTVGTPMDVEG